MTLNPFDLSTILGLGFAGIVLAVLFYVLLKVVAYVHDQAETARERTNFVNNVKSHIAVSYGDYLRSYQQYDTLAHDLDTKIKADEKDAEDTEPKDDENTGLMRSIAERFADLNVRLIEFVSGEEEAAPPAKPVNRDIGYTEGYFDAAEVAANLDKFPRNEGALALWFIELHEFQKKAIDTWNASNDEVTDKDKLRFVRKARRTCAEATLVARAFLDPEVRRVLKAGPKTGENNTDLVKRVFTDYIEKDFDPALEAREIPIGAVPLRAGALWTTWVKPKRHWETGWFLLTVVVAIALAAGGVYFMRDRLDRPVACKSIWKPGAESAELTCDYTAKSIEAALGRVIGDDGRAALFESLSSPALSCTATRKPGETEATMVCSFVAATPEEARDRLELLNLGAAEAAEGDEDAADAETETAPEAPAE